jgi:hypothetical protein
LEALINTLVVIEHDPARLVMLAMILRALGYRVLEAGNLDEALREGEAHAGPIALALCDAQTAASSATNTQSFHRFHPETRFVAWCGLMPMAVVSRRRPKPLDVEVLAAGLRDLLETARAPNVCHAGTQS